MKTLLRTEQIFFFFSSSSFIFGHNLCLDLIVSPFLSLLPETDLNPTLRWCMLQNFLGSGTAAKRCFHANRLSL
jgi:hypothetical protein